MKRVIVIFIIISMLFLSSCGGTGGFFDTLVTERALGKTLVKDFFFLIGNDVEAAKNLLHPNFYAENGGFEAFVEDFKQEHNADILDGISIVGWSGGGSGSGYYPADDYKYTYQQYRYELIVGLKPMSIYVEVRTDEYGYGIYTFEESIDQ